MTLQLAQCGGLLGSFDAFGHGAEAEGAGEIDDELADRELRRVDGDVVDEGLVDLQDVERQAAEVVERGVAGAEVVDRESDAEVLELTQTVAAAATSLIITSSISSSTSELGREARPVERAAHGLDDVGLEHLGRREVHRQREALLRIAIEPFAGLPTCRVEDPGSDRDDGARLLGDVDEVGRAEQAARRVFPADQCLDPDQAPGVEGHDRLVVQDELVGDERAPQLALELDAIDHRRVHVRLEELVSTASRVLHRVHRDVGVAQELVDRVGAAVERDADARVDHRLDTCDAERHRQCIKQTLRDPRCLLLGADVFEKDRELVAAETGCGVGWSDTRKQPLRDAAEQRVAGRVSEAVVDILEPVEIDEQHGERAGTTTGTGERVPDAVLEQRAVRKPGQRIAEALLFVEAPGDDARDARGENEAAVDERPLHGMGDRVRMVVHRRRIDDAEDAVVHDDEADGEQERQPVLVERQDADHHEEVEVHLDHAAAETDEHRRRRHEPERRHRRDELAPSLVGRREAGEHRDDPRALQTLHEPRPTIRAKQKMPSTCARNRNESVRCRTRQTSSLSDCPPGR